MNAAPIQTGRDWSTFAVAGAWLLVCVLCAIVYWPGLHGPFVFDDFGSIATIGDQGGIRDWAAFKAYVFGGHTGPTGRPLALASFLIDATDWPADSWPFKRTNLVIHIMTGTLLYLLVQKLLGLLDYARRDSRWLALLTAAAWLLHPFLVSTTLYAVQRMAQLSTLFTFAGLLGYLHGRTLITSNATRAYLIMSASIAVFTFLAMISKENGILLPMLVGVLEITVIASRRMPVASLSRPWAAVFIVLPSAVIAAYLGSQLFRGNIFDGIPLRDFSLYERLLTQPRVLVDYLRHWFLPDLFTAGVFQDHFVKSTGLFAPLTTAFSLLFHAGLIALALIKRRAWPLFALAVLFFYAGHLLESTTVNLELYFEHRNYLPAAFLFLPLFGLLQQKVGHRLFFATGMIILLVFAGFTRYSASLWVDYPSLVEAAAEKAPTSARAQSQYAVNLYNAGRYEEASRVIANAIRNRPLDASLQLASSIIHCHLGLLDADDFANASEIISSQLYDPRSVETYTKLAVAIVDGECPAVTIGALRQMFENMLKVPGNANPAALAYSQIQYFIGLANVRGGNIEPAIAAFNESLASRPGPGHAMQMAAVLASSEYYDEALQFAERALQDLRNSQGGVLRGARLREQDILTFLAEVSAERDGASATLP